MAQEPVFPILPNIYSINHIDLYCEELGMDSRGFAEKASPQALKHFDNYPYKVSYQYNNRGFRGSNWPNTKEELAQAVWCVGDSFTFGVAVPLEHSWPYILEQRANRKTISMSANGVGNSWIVEFALDVIDEVAPTDMILHWSYTHRRKVDRWNHVHHLNTTPEDDADLMIELIREIESKKQSTNLIHSFIPDFHGNCNEMYNRIVRTFPNIKIIPYLTKLDLGRDNHHYDIITATNFVDKIIKIL